MSNSPLPAWMGTAAREARARFQGAGMALTLGGEPTYVPLDPQGPEWSVAADGPTKLPLARALAAELQRSSLPGSLCFFCPGKHYPGETNPRWALRLLCQRDLSPLVPWPGSGPLAEPPQELLKAIGAALGLGLEPVKLKDPLAPERQVWAVPLSHDGEAWASSPWPLAEAEQLLVATEGPPGLRLPLQQLPEGVPRQVLTLDQTSDGWGLFLPPLEQDSFEELIRAIAALLASKALTAPELSGVLPFDLEARWTVLGLAADPGVLEINLPVCANWESYAGWLLQLEAAGAQVGLRSWKQDPAGQTSGTGGGNHLLWGGPTLAENPLFQRPAWLVALLRTWQHHPSLSYLFGSDPVGPASQAPRADAIACDLLDLELALSSLEQLPEGDHRQAIGETMRHLQVDRSGNSHRSEISFDKYWNPGSMVGCQGLLEFRALESLPEAQWMAAVALLWSCLGAQLLDPEQRPRKLMAHGQRLHDRYLLPSVLWQDLEGLLLELGLNGLRLDPEFYHQIWEWRFPLLLQWQEGNCRLWVRRALEPWPLLSDMPELGAITSRFVDTSLERLEIGCSGGFLEQYQLRLNGRSLPLQRGVVIPEAAEALVGVRYRHSHLYPCLHPQLPVDLPLQLSIEKHNGTPVAWFERRADKSEFVVGNSENWPPQNDQPLTTWHREDICVDLRLS